MAATILLLVGIIVREVWQVMQARRRGRAAARLHIQIVSLFSVIAVLPAVLVAIVANVTIDRGLDRLFSGPTREAIQNSLTIASAYTNEHAQLIQGDILGMANDIAPCPAAVRPGSRDRFSELLTASAASRNLPGAMLIDKDRNILEIGANRHSTDLRAAAAGIPEQCRRNRAGDRGVPRRKLRRGGDPAARLQRHLPLCRPPARSRAWSRSSGKPRPASPNMPRLESRRLGIQVSFALMFAVIALTILMASVLIGLNFANWLVAPIRRLMSAANIVSTGDLHVQVPVHNSEGDLAQLGETFNKMTQELRTQRDELVSASDLIDSRRRFIEAVLSSASAGIIGVDASGSVGILNRSAEKLIGHAESETLGSSAVGCAARTRRHDENRARGHAAAGAGPDHDQPRRP